MLRKNLIVNWTRLHSMGKQGNGKGVDQTKYFKWFQGDKDLTC
jgi:hypothetical protein